MVLWMLLNKTDWSLWTYKYTPSFEKCWIKFHQKMCWWCRGARWDKCLAVPIGEQAWNFRSCIWVSSDWSRLRLCLGSTPGRAARAQIMHAWPIYREWVRPRALLILGSSSKFGGLTHHYIWESQVDLGLKHVLKLSTYSAMALVTLVRWVPQKMILYIYCLFKFSNSLALSIT